MPQIELNDFEKVALSAPRLDPGVYTFNVHEMPEIKKTDNEKVYINLPMKVVEGPNQKEPDPNTGSFSPVGKVFHDRLYTGAAFRIKRMLVASGLLAKDDVTSDLARGKLDTAILVGARFQASLTPKLNNGKEYLEVDYII
jgi:hypothetical protein